jgi:hypothetical protein
MANGVLERELSFLYVIARTQGHRGCVY